jgi:hypothetical protein
MELQHLLEWLLNQAAVVVVMGIVIYFQQKEKLKLIDNQEKLVKEHRQEIAKLRDHSSKKDLEQLESLSNVNTLLDRNIEGQKEIKEVALKEIKDVKDLMLETKDSVLTKFDEFKNYLINGKLG